MGSPNMSNPRTIYLVEDKVSSRAWEPRSLVFYSRTSALGYIEGLVKNAGYARRKLRTARFRRWP